MLKKLIVLTGCVLVLTLPHDGWAAQKGKKKKKPKNPNSELNLSQIINIQVALTEKDKTTFHDVTCYKDEGGVLKGKKFTTFSQMAKQFSAKAKAAKKNKSLKKKAALYKSLAGVSREECRQPDYLSLAPYRGIFTEKEARTLYERFAFAGNPDQIANAVRIGLDATVNDLMAIKPEPHLDAEELELRCDGYLADDTRNENNDPEQCPPGNLNAVRDSGVRFDIYNRIWNSANPYYHKLWLFLHDERMAAGSNVLNYCSRYAIVDHVNLLRRAALSGDYRQFMVDWNNDYLGHLVWLDGKSNTGQSPNENYAREFWELGTVGPTGLDGLPVYSDLDIAQSALAFSGWIEDYDDFKDSLGNDYDLCFGAKATKQHAPGPKTIFIGTPWQAIVEDDMGVLNATFAHPRTAEHLAEDIWREFINPYARDKEIKQLAQLIRDSGYKLHPVFKKIMTSRALFAKRSYKSLIKHPLELTFGFLKQTGIPVPDSFYFDQNQGRYFTGSNRFEQLEWNVIDDLGQVPTLPPTVFGWNERRLAAEQWVLPWRNAVMWLINQDSKVLQTQTGFTFRNKFFAGIPTASNAADVFVDRLAGYLGVELSPGSRAHLIQFMNYDYVTCSQSEKSNPSLGCDGYGKRLKYSLFDPNPQSDSNNETDARGIIAAIAMHPAYRLK